MDKKLEKKIVLRGPYEDVISENEHFHIYHKYDKICVLPYTISDKGLLHKIGIIKEIDAIKEKENFVLIEDYIKKDDPTNLVAANRILYELIGSNVKGADNWMYLGKIYNIVGANSIFIYAVNLTDVEINDSEIVEETKKASKFEMVESNRVITSDDALFLAAYMRVFNYFYVNSLQK